MRASPETKSDLPPASARPSPRSRVRKFQQARSLGQKVSHLTDLKLSDVRPYIPAVVNCTSGLSMGEHTEITVKEWGIARELTELPEAAVQLIDSATQAALRGATPIDLFSPTWSCRAARMAASSRRRRARCARASRCCSPRASRTPSPQMTAKTIWAQVLLTKPYQKTMLAHRVRAALDGPATPS